MRVLQNKSSFVATLLLGLVLQLSAARNAEGVINHAHREVTMTEPDVVIYTNHMDFTVGHLNYVKGKLIFEYVVAVDYDNTLVDIVAFDSGTKYMMNVTRSDSPLKFSEDHVAYNATDFIWFQIDVTEHMNGDRVEMEVNEYHKRRREAWPKKLSLLDEQTMRISDSRYLLSPYQVLLQTTTYLIEPQDLIEYTKVDGAKKNERGVKYGQYKMMSAYSFDLVTLLFKIQDPQLILTEASKTVHVSHWGFISVDEYFNLQNIGAELKGEFSRVDFHKNGMALNCMRQISASYPWYIQSMYFNDYIGNISSTNAKREEEMVKVDYYPRFPVCGGWKVDWNLGYKMPTKYHLSKESEKDDLYTMEIPFLHNYDVLLAENYTFEVVLPFGAVDIQFDAPFKIDQQYLERATGTLDFFGAPKLVLKKNNVQSHLHNHKIKVFYRFNESFILLKPLGLAATVFAFYLAAILFSRVSLSFAESPKKEKVE